MARGKVKYKDVVGGGKKKENNQKRKFNGRNSNRKNKPKPNKKRRIHEYPEEKVEEITKNTEIEEETSESEEEEDQMLQLRASFSSNVIKKQISSIESEEDSSSEESNNEEEEEAVSVKSEDDVSAVEDDFKLEDETEAEDVNEDIQDDANDPFVNHICFELHDSVIASLQSCPLLMQESVHTWPLLGRIIVQIPQYQDIIKDTNPFSIEQEKKLTRPPSIPNIIIGGDLTSLKKQYIKSQIINSISKANDGASEDKLLTNLQRELFSILNNYQDLYFSSRNFTNSEEIRFVYTLHALNHVLKTRLKVVHHNARLTNKDDVPEDFRDQGLVRPKVLIIAPFRDSAYRIVQILIKILLEEDKGHVMNKKRFFDEFTGNELQMPKKNPKPEDYEQTFSGNTGDDFKIGITVTKKSLKLYADFYSSDIIIASPLGLRTIIGAEGEGERDYDFLASLEVLILDQVELFLMQNWDHLVHVFNHLHMQPKTSHGTDFSRIRTWSLNGWAKYYRQTLIFSSITLPEINAIFNKKCNNHAGKVKVANPVEFGTIKQVLLQLPHVFHKFQSGNPQQAVDARFEFFLNKIFPQQRDGLMKQTLIFVPSYFDYVRLRNYFKREEISFVQICEYSKDAKVARARDMFYHGDAHFLLYTERYHFFNRIRVKGIRHLVFYEPPTFPHFYYEMCNLMQEGNMNKKVGNMSNMTVNILYSKYDIHRIAAIVGTERAKKMLESDKNVHMLLTGAD